MGIISIRGPYVTFFPKKKYSFLAFLFTLYETERRTSSKMYFAIVLATK